MMRLPRWSPVVLLAAAAGCHHAPHPVPAGSGRAVLQRMHAAYRDSWYHTLTFVQKTTTFRNGTPDTSTWYESLKAPDKLRIDQGLPTLGNGALYTADSEIVMRAGQVARRIGTGNPFIPLIEGVYVQPLPETERQLAPYGFALERMYTGTWEGRPAYVVGALDAGDTTSAQFWVDTERLVLVRMLVRFGGANGPLIDTRLGGYVQLAGPSWLATHNEFMVGGRMVQTEDYSDWRINVELPDLLFDPAHWTTARHWATSPTP